MPQRPPPTVRLRRLASELRKLRNNVNLTRDDVAEVTGINSATLYRIESAKTKPQARTLRSLMDVYQATDSKRAELLAILKDAGEREWLQSGSGIPDQYATYIQFESEAKRLLNYQGLFVPGLLQTEDYARAVIRGTAPTASRDEIESRVAARVERQARLADAQSLQLWAIVDEAALRRMVGGTQTMHAQLERLLEVVEEPNITFQAIPFSAGSHPGMPGGFVVMQFTEGAPDLIYIEHVTADLFLENETDSSRCILLFDHLRAVAASPTETQALVADILAKK
ncbi:helix-turn-helix transcriptional regulator [Nonomuraea sp. NPDC046570]|uniref:helix-turn-helix domain-containing protein n=1 Tax=Nonomuraea sp. NPDC046570 TaxID=3155255 RepID=UPI0033FFFE83